MDPEHPAETGGGGGSWWYLQRVGICISYCLLLALSLHNLRTFETRSSLQVAEVVVMLFVGYGLLRRWHLATLAVTLLTVAVAMCALGYGLPTNVWRHLRRPPQHRWYPQIIADEEAMTTVVRTGDLLLFRDDGLHGRVRRILFNEPWSHVAMFLVPHPDEPLVIEMDRKRLSVTRWRDWLDRWVLQGTGEVVVAWRGLVNHAATDRTNARGLTHLQQCLPVNGCSYPTVLLFCLQYASGLWWDNRRRNANVHCAQLIVHLLHRMGVVVATDNRLMPGDYSVCSGRFDRLVSSEYRYLPERLLRLARRQPS